MSNLFDNIQQTAFSLVTKTFGYTATWMPSNAAGQVEQSATVLYKDATEKKGISDYDFEIERYVMEYQAGDFTGLKENVFRGKDEIVKIETLPGVWLQFLVKKIETKYDGKTIKAILNQPQ